MRTFVCVMILCLSWACGGGGGSASFVPPSPPSTGTFQTTTLTSALTAPTAMAQAPDGRIFVCEQAGHLRVIKNNALLATPMLTVSVDSTGERGLIGVAVDPSFASNGFVYVHYTVSAAPIHNRISRFTAVGDTADPATEFVLLDLDNLGPATNHNGGAIHFGPDGKLYAGVGDNANGANSQNLTTLLGKMLRMNSDGSVPGDNPLLSSTAGNRQLIWAYGLRNPFTFAFQPGTGLLFINDVGESSWEEVDQGVAGANYGWPTTEGPTSNPAFTAPFFAYPHTGGIITGCAIVGAAFYNPATSNFPSRFTGQYLFMDLCGGWIKRMDPTTADVQDWLTGFITPVDILVEPSGSVLVLSRGGGGALARVTFVPSS